MKVTDKLMVSLDATLGWQMLPRAEREKLTNKLAPLAGMPCEQWPKNVLRHLPTEEPR
jgi:hypothetical protein